MSSPSASDLDFLNKALELARQRKGCTSPNPAVGAVVVKEGKILGKGTHWASGYPHAEVEALKEVSHPEGATIYVTLEPCCHFGKTPPCTELLKEKKIKRAVYAYQDPNPQVQGRGEQILRESGLAVTHAPVPEIDTFYQSYRKWILTERTWMTGKLALTLDGKVGETLRSRFQITGQSAAFDTHSRRNHADVLLTSANTVRVDDPLMNVRLGGEVKRKPVAIIDRTLQCEKKYRVFSEAKSISLICSRLVPARLKESVLNQGFDLIELAEQNSKLDFKDLSFELGKKGYHEAWCEWGPRLFLAFCQLSLFDEIVLLQSQQVTAPKAELDCCFEKKIVEKNYQLISKEDLGGDIREVWRTR